MTAVFDAGQICGAMTHRSLYSGRGAARRPGPVDLLAEPEPATPASQARQERSSACRLGSSAPDCPPMCCWWAACQH